MHHKFLQDSPSLRRYLDDDSLIKVYPTARADGFKETGLAFPNACPYGIDEVLN